MAFGGKKGTKFGIKLGDKAYGEMKLFDSQWLKKGNGIYADFVSQATRETFAGTVGAYIDGVIYRISSESGIYTDENLVAPNDTVGDSSTQTFTVEFTNSTDKCVIVSNFVKNTKVPELAAAIKTLKFKDATDLELVVKKVGYKAIV